jgi:hypothetical protein
MTRMAATFNEISFEIDQCLLSLCIKSVTREMQECFSIYEATPVGRLIVQGLV